jgi:osmotically inducible protein OsmC
MATFSRRATLEWTGDVVHGTGTIVTGSRAFVVAATFPRLRGEPGGTTVPEELLAAAHATCFGIGLRSVLAQRGGSAERIRATATITAEKGSGRIRLVSAHVEGVVEGLAGLDVSALDECGRAAEDACTISAMLRASVPVTVEVRLG